MGGGCGGKGGGGDATRAPQSSQSVPYSHCAGTPWRAVSEPGPPSWHAS